MNPFNSNQNANPSGFNSNLQSALANSNLSLESLGYTAKDIRNPQDIANEINAANSVNSEQPNVNNQTVGKKDVFSQYGYNSFDPQNPPEVIPVADNYQQTVPAPSFGRQVNQQPQVPAYQQESEFPEMDLGFGDLINDAQGYNMAQNPSANQQQFVNQVPVTAPVYSNQPRPGDNTLYTSNPPKYGHTNNLTSHQPQKDYQSLAKESFHAPVIQQTKPENAIPEHMYNPNASVPKDQAMLNNVQNLVNNAMAEEKAAAPKQLDLSVKNPKDSVYPLHEKENVLLSLASMGKWSKTYRIGVEGSVIKPMTISFTSLSDELTEKMNDELFRIDMMGELRKSSIRLDDGSYQELETRYHPDSARQTKLTMLSYYCVNFSGEKFDNQQQAYKKLLDMSPAISNFLYMRVLTEFIKLEREAMAQLSFL